MQKPVPGAADLWGNKWIAGIPGAAAHRFQPSAFEIGIDQGPTGIHDHPALLSKLAPNDPATYQCEFAMADIFAIIHACANWN